MSSSKFKMGYYKKSEVNVAYKPNSKEIETVEQVSKYPIMAVDHRQITLEAAKYFGIRSSVSEQDGKTITATYYPYRDKYGKITGY